MTPGFRLRISTLEPNNHFNNEESQEAHSTYRAGVKQFLPKFPVDNNPVLVKIMVWRRIDDKPLSEPILIRFTDAYMRH